MKSILSVLSVLVFSAGLFAGSAYAQTAQGQAADNLNKQPAEEQTAPALDDAANTAADEAAADTSAEDNAAADKEEDSSPKAETLEFVNFPKELNFAQDFTVSLTLPVPAEVDKNDFKQKDFEVLSVTPDISGLNMEVKAVPFALNEAVFAPLTFTSADGKIFKTAAVNTKVNPVKTGFKEEEMQDIRSPYRPFNYFILLWILLAAAVLFALYRFLKKKAKVIADRKLKEMQQDKRPIDVIALDRLDHLILGDLWPQHQYKTFYIGMIDILRDYLSARFNIDAHQYTSRDLLRTLRKMPAYKGDIKHLADLQRSADYVKFAKAEPTDAQRDEDISNMRNVIIDTRPPHTDIVQNNTENKPL